MTSCIFLFRRISEDQHLFEFGDVVDWTTSLKQHCIHISVNVSTRSAYTLWPRPKKGHYFQITFQTHFVKCKWKILLYMDSILTKMFPTLQLQMFVICLDHDLASRRRQAIIWTNYGPLTTYIKLRDAHAPGIPGALSMPSQVSDTDIRWRGIRSRHYRRMRNPQFTYLVLGPWRMYASLDLDESGNDGWWFNYPLSM